MWKPGWNNKEHKSKDLQLKGLDSIPCELYFSKFYINSFVNIKFYIFREVKLVQEPDVHQTSGTPDEKSSWTLLVHPVSVEFLAVAQRFSVLSGN